MAYIGNQPFNQSFLVNTFSGNGLTTQFSLTVAPASPASVIVAVSGVLQDPSTYGVVGNLLTFTQAPPSGTNNISVRFLGLTASGATTTAYRTVSEFTASAGQTTFSVSSYTPGFIDVFRNGVRLATSNYVATNGATVVLNNPCAAGDLVVTESFFVSSVINALPNVTGSIGPAYLQNGSINQSIIDVYSANGTGGIAVPAGTTAQRPASTTNGSIRYNTTTGQMETNILGFWFQEAQDGYTTITGKTRTVFQFTGSNQSFTVPAGITHIFVKMWGAGGGGGSYGGWRQGSTGGGGGYTEAIVPVTPGSVLTVRVGGRGVARPSNLLAWPDGGGASLSGGDNQYTANGGASSSLIVPTISGSPCMYAGGGGGGGSVTGWARNPGGAGGGLRGEDGYIDVGAQNTVYTQFSLVGKGGTQTAGGGAGAGSNTTGGAGSLGLGGTHQNANCYGGGGGGGFYGGGSGAYGNGNSMGGGGGGSGFIHPSLIRAQTLTGVREYPPCANDPDAIEFSTGAATRIGVGGDEATSGGHGLVVFYY